jgi:hypothetical protein
MNDQPDISNAAPTESSQASASRAQRPTFAIHRSWRFSLAAAIIMLLLALLGVGLTTTNWGIAQTFWISLVPVYGLLCIATAWSRAHYEEGSQLMILRQVFHWLGIAVALGLDFYVRGTGEEPAAAASFNAILLLALGCYLAGVHLEWLFSLVGVLLTLLLFVVVKAEQYLWLIAVVGLVAAAVMIWLIRLVNRTEQRPGGSGPPST